MDISGRQGLVPLLALIVVAGALYWYGGYPVPGLDTALDDSTDTADAAWRAQVQDTAPHNATFAGGCFWCIEAVYDGRKGIASAVSGYTGGAAANATYEKVVTGTTDHREAVRVRYYPSLISYEELVMLYWQSIDPTDASGQFADKGYQYTTAIYAHTPEQYRLAKTSKRNISESGRFEDPIVTEVLNATTFYRAEDRHQNYSSRRTMAYKAYERASGRKGFVERVWDASPLG